MNKILITALATTLVGTTSFATDSERLELEREVAAWNNAPLLQDSTGPNVSGWIIGAFSSTDAGNTGGVDTTGTGVHSAAVNLHGALGHGYSYTVGFEFFDSAELYNPSTVNADDTIAGDPASSGFSSGSAGITDAYISFGVGEGVGVKMGIFGNNSLKSAGVARNQTLFIDRSYLGSMFSSRDVGFALDGSFNRVNWELAVQNGRDGSGEELAYSGHIDIDLYGTQSGHEGAHGAAEGLALNVGLTFMSDASKSDNRDDFADDGTLNDSIADGSDRDDSTTMFDINLTSGAWAAFAEMADFGADQDAAVAGIQTAAPFSAGVSYAWSELYEIGFRFDDYDDAANTTRYVFGVNRYVSGHDMKWQLNFVGGTSDPILNGTAPTTENDSSAILLGFAAGF